MIVRVRFGKEGALRFVGHLDILRTFQKIFRRAGIPMTYSAGFNPHPIMSFALPLGLGLTSEGEYLDAGVEDGFPADRILPLLQAASPEELPVYAVSLLPDDAENAMSTVGKAFYRIEIPDETDPLRVQAAAEAFLAAPEFIISKKTKTKTADTDIRPMVFALAVEGNTICADLAAGSIANLKPELLLESIAGEFYSFNAARWGIRRMELFDHAGRSLGSIGRPLETGDKL